MKTSKWRDLRGQTVKPGDEPRVAALRELMRTERLLYRLRQRRHLTQAQLAQRLDISQSSVSQFERADDVKLSTLEDYIAALDGRLEISVIFDDERLLITDLADA